MKKGTKVEIYIGKPLKMIGVAKYVRSERWKFGRSNEIIIIKVFKFNNKLYREFECSWIEVSKANKIKNKIKLVSLNTQLS